MRTAIQLYSLRDCDQPMSQLLPRVAAAGFAGVEFAGVPDLASGGVLARTGLDPVAAHVDIETLEADLPAAVEACTAVGCRTLVVPWVGPDGFDSVGAVERTADRLAGLADRVADHDCRLCYHNHAHEFADLGDESAFDLLCDRTPSTLSLELDLGWVRAAGDDPVERLTDLADRVPLVHLKDVDADGHPVELGEGVLDVAGCGRAIRAAGVERCVYEHDRPTDPLASLSHGAGVLASL